MIFIMKFNKSLLKFTLITCLITNVTSCDSQVVNKKEFKLSKKKNTIKSNTSEKISVAGNNNPVMMQFGSDIGTMFSAYYRVGETEKMISLLDSKTKIKYSRNQLNNLLLNLNLGFDLKLTGMKDLNGSKIMSYVCQINATKKIKRLIVIIENDTARIVPSNLEKGEIFQ